MKQRESYWDVVKGIAIVSIVIGHAVDFLSPYVYLYHLAIFFFVGGYFYNENKYVDAPYMYVGKLFQGVYFKYVAYTWLLIALHNFNVRFGLYYNLGYYHWKDYLYWASDALVFQNPEMFGGALWFVPVYIVVLSLLGFTVSFANRISHDNKIIKHIIMMLSAIAIGSAGIILNLNGLELAFHIHTSLIIYPIVLLAYYIKVYVPDIKKYAKVWLTPIFLVALWCIINILKWRVELSKEQIVSGPMFYIVSIIGIIFCLCLGNCFNCLKWTRVLFSFLGKYSFAIMALHFWVIKLVDRVYCYAIGEKDPAIIGAWVCAYSDKLWIIYVIAGSIVPAVLIYSAKKLGMKTQEIIKRREV